MAKKKKVPLNVLVKEETRGAVKFLAETLERSQGEVVDEAVEFYEAHNGGESRVVVSYPPPQPTEANDPRRVLAETEQRLNVKPRETATEQAMRERAERAARVAALDKSAGDRSDIDRSDEYVSG